MAEKLANINEIDEIRIGLHTLIFAWLAFLEGLLLAVIVLPQWLPTLAASLLGDSPKAYWYLARGTGFIGFVVLWLSMLLGLTMTNKMARLWPGGPAAFEIHKFTSLLGLGIALFHGLVLLGDRYVGYTLGQILIPFASSNYQPLWVGIGQVGFYAWGIIVLSHYLRGRLGKKSWRLIHYTSFVAYLMATWHGLMSGTDSGAIWALAVYWFATGSLMILFVYRIIVGLVNSRSSEIPQTSR